MSANKTTNHILFAMAVVIISCLLSALLAGCQSSATFDMIPRSDMNGVEIRLSDASGIHETTYPIEFDEEHVLLINPTIEEGSLNLHIVTDSEANPYTFVINGRWPIAYELPDGAYELSVDAENATGLVTIASVDRSAIGEDIEITPTFGTGLTYYTYLPA